MNVKINQKEWQRATKPLKYCDTVPLKVLTYHQKRFGRCLGPKLFCCTNPTNRRTGFCVDFVQDLHTVLSQALVGPLYEIEASNEI
jgi:hypothetical protein